MSDGSFPEWLYIIANAVQAAGHERLAQDLRSEHILGTNGVWEPDVAKLTAGSVESENSNTSVALPNSVQSASWPPSQPLLPKPRSRSDLL